MMQPMGDQILSSLEDRKKIMTEFQSEMKHVTSFVNHFHKEVKYILDNKLSSSAISHLAFSLTTHLVKTIQKAEDYKKMVTWYLLDDCYDANYDMLMDFKDAAEECLRVMANIRDHNVFSFDDDDQNDVTKNHFFIKGFCKDLFSLYELRKEMDLSQVNGMQLLNALHTEISAIATLLIDIKNNSTFYFIEEFRLIFQANFRLYENCYWPSLYDSFRSLHNYPYRDVSVESLKDILQEEINHFAVSPEGQLWRDYGNDEGVFAQKLKNKNLDENQWHYVFSNLVRFNEYKKWINELEHPYKADKVYPISKWDKIFKDVIDVGKVKKEIDMLLSSDFSKTNCFVLHKILCEIQWLQDEIATHFISWIDDIYGWDASAKDFKSIHPNLKNQHSLDWDLRTMTSGKISKDYINLADNIRNKFVKKMEGKNVIEDNKFYFIKPELYIKHKVWP